MATTPLLTDDEKRNLATDWFDDGAEQQRYAIALVGDVEKAVLARVESRIAALAEENERLDSGWAEANRVMLENSIERDSARAELDETRLDRDSWRNGALESASEAAKWRAERDAARARVESLESDLLLAKSAPLYSTRANAKRYEWLRSFATPGQRPAADATPMNYRGIRLRVDTPVYMPSTWATDIDRAIDAAMFNAGIAPTTDGGGTTAEGAEL